MLPCHNQKEGLAAHGHNHTPNRGHTDHDSLKAGPSGSFASTDCGRGEWARHRLGAASHLGLTQTPSTSTYLKIGDSMGVLSISTCMRRVRDDQWERIREHCPEEHIQENRAGRKPVPARAVLEAVLWILNTGAHWHLLPQCSPHDKTVHRRFQQWCEREVLRAILTQLANTLRDEGAIDERERVIDAMFAAAKGGGDDIGNTRRGTGVKILAIVDRHGLPLSVSTHAANHHEVTVVQLSFGFYMLEAKPEHLIGDRAYDSDGLDENLKQDGVHLIAPHRSTRKLKTQDGRHLRRSQRRWLVERFFAWLPWKRRLLIRWEYYATNFLGFVQLAPITMLLKQF